MLIDTIERTKVKVLYTHTHTHIEYTVILGKMVYLLFAESQSRRSSEPVRAAAVCCFVFSVAGDADAGSVLRF